MTNLTKTQRIQRQNIRNAFFCESEELIRAAMVRQCEFGKLCCEELIEEIRAEAS